MKNYFWLILLITIGSYCCAQEEKPNIVLLFVDDYGWSDVGYRNPTFHTPNIDQLKNDGLEFVRAYIPTPTCSPSRASLLTGKEAIRMNLPRHISGGPENEFNYWPEDPVQRPSRNWLPLEEVTYAERLKEHGYYNMFIGKWHLGHEPYYPIHQGFDEQYGITTAGHPKSYYPPFFKNEDGMSQFSNDEMSDSTYLTDLLSDKAVEFIKNYDRKQPFMLSLWLYNVHSPFVGRKDLVKRYKSEGLESDYAEYAAMVTAMDESVGRVRNALGENGISGNTVFIFLSDQGGKFNNTPLSGAKNGGNTLGEGGARVPFIVYYPGVTKPASVCEVPVQSIDLYPTLIEIASGEKCTDPQINGRSLLPSLEGKTIKARDLFFFRSYEDQYAAVISGEWKLIKYHSGKYRLFDVVDDISEKSNLVTMEPKKFEKLKTKLLDWEKEAVPQF